jgi:putative transposase
MVNDIRYYFGHTQNRACTVIGMSRSSYRYTPKPENNEELILRMKQLAQEKLRYGVRRLHTLLKKEGLVINHKRTERLYKKEGLAIRTKKPKKHNTTIRLPLPVPREINEQWAMDFIHDTNSEGRRFRCFSILDICSRECLAIRVDTSIPAKSVVDAMDRLIETRGKPSLIITDNGPEFTSNTFHTWAYEKGIKLCFIHPGKPMENAFIESFQGRLRDECLNLHWFSTIQNARDKIERWRIEYNTERPHSSLNGLTPVEYAEQMVLTG